MTSRQPPSRFRFASFASRLVIALVALLASQAHAVDALRGKTLYLTTPGSTSCANSGCHGTDPTRNKNKVLRGANSPTTIQNAINNNTGGMGIYRTTLTSVDVADIAAYLGNPGVTGGPVASISPTSLAFPSTTTGSTSATQTVTLSNTGTAALAISAISSSSTDFITSGGSCAAGGSVAAGGNCTVLVAFRPQATGARTGTLTITHNASPTTSTVALSGTGAGSAVASVSPTSVNFGSVTTGATSSAQTVTVSNTGSAALTLGTIGTGSTIFTVTGGTCTNGGTVAASTGSCTVLVSFSPTATGAASGTLTITHNAAGSPLSVALSGTGTAPAAPVASLSPTSLSFSQVVATTSAAQIVTLANTGNAALAISSIGFTGTAAADYAVATGSTCTAGGSVAAGSNCTIRITFTPGATGSRPASLAVAHNAAGSPSSVTLNGTGTAAPIGAITVNRNALSYAAQSLGTSSAPQSVTVGNGGSAPLTLATLALSGSHAGDYAISGGTCATGTTLAVGASCTVATTFTPTVASGTRTATLTIGAGSAGTATVSLSGTAAAAAAPLVSLSPTSLAFGSVTIGSSSAVRTSTLTNTGSAPLALSSLTASPATYALSHDCPASLAVSASCTLSVTFTPAASGAVNGSVAIVSNAASSTDTVTLTGTGVMSSPAALSWIGSSSLSFADTATGAQSAAQALTLTNTGTTAATLNGFPLSGPAAAEFVIDGSSTCTVGGTLAGGGNCTLQIVFAPSATGARSATLDVSSTGTAPTSATLSGNGVSGGAPVLTLMPSSITFTNTPGQPLQPQTLVVQNDGAGPLLVTVMTADGGMALRYANSASGGSCSAPPFTVAPGASCTVVVQPTGNSVSGSVSVTSNASATPASVPASGMALTNQGSAGSGEGLLALALVPLLFRRRGVRR